MSCNHLLKNQKLLQGSLRKNKRRFQKNSEKVFIQNIMQPKNQNQLGKDLRKLILKLRKHKRVLSLTKKQKCQRKNHTNKKS